MTQLRKIEGEDQGKRYRLIRADTMQEVPGVIVTADVESGTAALRTQKSIEVLEDGTRKVEYETTSHSFGSGGLILVRR